MAKPILESASLSSVAGNALQAGHRFRVRLIEGDRWGSSGYYSGDVLQEAAKSGIFHKGLPMYLDHPTESEANERPERSVLELAGALDSDAIYEANNPEGPGLYGDVRVYSHVAPVINEMKDDIGLSIRAFGEIGYGDAAGRSGPIVEKLTGAASVDYVTQAGAGGKIMQLLESARKVDETRPNVLVREATVEDLRDQLSNALPPHSYVRDFDPDSKIVYFVHYDAVTDEGATYQQSYAIGDDGAALTGSPQEVRVTTTYVPVSAGQETPTTESTQEVDMPQIEEAELGQLREAASRVSKLEAELDEARKERDQAIAEAKARDLAESASKRAREAVKDLPTVMGDRIVREAARDLPLKDGVLDEAAFDKRVADAITAEQDYAKSFALGGLVGFGESTGVTESKPTVRTNPWGREIKEG